MENLGKKISEIFDTNNKYIIPLYQRNYAWGKEQIETLIQDIYEAWCKNNNDKGNYYIGSLVVLRRHNGDYEVIDGQQRLTTLSLLTKILGKTNAPVLYYESRPEVEQFFAEFYQSENATCKTLKPQTHYLREAIICIKQAKVLVNGKEDKPFNVWSKEIGDYLMNNVILVRTEIPEDTDVATYFEIMNNRGEQLQKHEILKAKLMNALDSKYHNEFNLIWTACSNMDRPIQQCFKVDDRERYFGENYEEFVFTGLRDDLQDSSDDNNKGNSITEILKGKDNIPSSRLQTGIERNSHGPLENESENDYSVVNSIIDFPNFLMHIIKLFAEREKQSNESDKNISVRLNEKFMLNDAEYVFGKEVESDIAKEFLLYLFKTRTLFDRYVIKIKPGESEDDFSWVLNRPQIYEKSVKYNLFTFNGQLQEQLIKAQSMLQVTYRQRIYKNWLQNLLKHLNNQKCNLSQIGGDKILTCLHNFMLGQYDNLKINFENMYKEGVNTPHFLLNFIDYLYWVKDKTQIKDFDFRYWNSVEHHLAVNYAKEITGTERDIVDCLGNLFLISKYANSRLNDRSVGEKIERFKERNMGANRQIIYAKGSNWNETEIKEHYEELKCLLQEHKKILELSD